MTEADSPRTAVIYARISQDRTGAGLGVERQEQDCRALAERLGWQVVAVYTDNDVSAYSGRKRPGYEALLADLESGKATGVLAWHTDRLHRSPLELERYITVCESHDVITHTVQAGELDLSTATGKMQARIVGAVARHESEHKGERVRRARQQKAEAGGWSGGVRPFGFEPDGVTIRPSEAAEIVKAADAIVAGDSLRSVIRDLNDRGITTTFGRRKKLTDSGESEWIDLGKQWTAVAFKDVLLRPRNAGLAVYQGEVIGRASWPPIIPEETWRAVVSILANPDRRTNGGANRVKWLGSGLYVCGVCERPTLRASTSGSHRKPAYRCKAREDTFESGHVVRSAELVDDYVERIIVARLQRRDAADLLTPTGSGPGVDTVALSKEATSIHQRLTDLSDAFAEDVVTVTQLRSGTEKMKARLAQINELQAAAAKVDPLADLAGRADADVVWFGTLPDRSDGLPLDRRRAALSSLMTVTVLPAGKGRRVDPSSPYFDPSKVRVDWKR